MRAPDIRVSLALAALACVSISLASKLDVLGDTFKRNVNEVKSWTQIDLIFLVDASSSVGEENFSSELRFVRKLLSDLTVSNEHTKVALITFGSQDSIITHINDVTNSNETSKCILLNELLPNIKYTGGGTYTIGAFKEAKRIVEHSVRNNTRKAVFLITDGFSNGGDPVPVAEELKNDYNVTIFTIGIKTGRGDELQNLSSSSETCYLLHGFREFESLARRALHADLQDGEYVPVALAKCDGTCDSERAECTCGIGSGQYACKCRRGYYGDGIQCQSCPKGTWHRAKDGICIPCSDPNHESYKAMSPEECKCKRGYRDNGTGRCEVVRCPELQAPKNGYFVGVPIKTGKCHNVLNNACGVRCQVGYSLRGNSIRLCQENGTWTGIEPQCVVKTCTKPPSPQYGQVIECVNRDLDTRFEGDEMPDDMPVDTECKFGCGKGHAMTGSTIRTCLPVAQWDGLRTTCKPVRCNRLGKVLHGHWEPEGCAKERQPFGARCTLICKRGFIPSGDSLTCKSATGRGAGKWLGTGNRCIDKEPPIIKCPAEHVVVQTEPGSQYGIAKWDAPKVADNSGLDVTVWLEPSEDEDHASNEFEIGLTLVTYHAVDSSGNEATCNMTVRVIDKEPPVIDNCENPPPFLTSDPAITPIQWDEPLAWDNSQGPVHMTRSRDFGILEVGTSEVVYTATDMFNNSNTCVINITVIAEASCDSPPMEAACNPTPGGVTCALTCQEGYGFALTDKAVCLHDSPGVWDIPECTPTETPNEIWEVLNAEAECTDNETIESLGTIVKEDGGIVVLSGCERNRRSVDEQKRLRRLEFRTKNTNKILEKAEEIGVNVTIGQPLINCKNGSVPAIRHPGQKIRCVLCPKGTYFGNNRCVPCPPDTYASKPGALVCESCPAGRSTMGRKRAKAKRACKAQCPVGTDRTQKGNTCESRPRKRLSCDRLNVCKNGGSCVPVGKSRHKCDCAPGWVGARCRIRAKVCLCQNGGTCHDNDSKCSCPQGFTGEFCELLESDFIAEVEDKTELPPTSTCQLVQDICENNSTCVDTSDGSYECKCTDGYIGRRCNILPCDYNPCSLNTICTNIIEPNATKQSHKCECPKGKQNPPECNTTIDNCASSPCMNSATCISEEPDSFKCQCRGLFYGDRCELLKDPDYVLHFPRSGINDFVIVDGPGTNLSEVTMCGWVQTNDKGNYGTVLSYATLNQDNAFTVTDYSGLVLYVNGQHVVTDVRLNDGRWHHLCVTWNMSQGAYTVYVDSKLEITGIGLSDGTHILGNGIIVLGQEQDTLGGRFSRSESFIGKLSYIDLWNKSLNKNEILETMQGCAASHIGNIRTWADFKNGTRGYVNIENSTFCSNCSSPLPPTNGQVTMAPDGRSATYTCDKGHLLHFKSEEIQGNILVRQCTAAAQWEGFEEPKCEPIACPYPGYVPHARVTGKFYNIRYKDQLVYNCLPGYEPIEPQTRTCTENGTWSGVKPLCRGGQCDSFIKPENSNITIISEHVYDEDLFEDISLFEVGTQLEIGCLNEAALQGEKLIACQENGTWDNEIPKCEIPGCAANEMPSIPVNSYTLNEISGVTFDVGTIIAFKCRNGHQQVGNNFTECFSNGKWMDLNMTCTPIECVVPTSYDNMHYRNGYNISTYYFGNMLKYECEEGYVFYGINTVRCSANGKWTRLKGKCGRISCNKPNVSSGESVVGSSYLYKDSLSVRCPSGSNNKDYNMTCTSAGKWLQVGDCKTARNKDEKR